MVRAGPIIPSVNAKEPRAPEAVLWLYNTLSAPMAIWPWLALLVVMTVNTPDVRLNDANSLTLTGKVTPATATSVHAMYSRPSGPKSIAPYVSLRTPPVMLA